MLTNRAAPTFLAVTSRPPMHAQIRSIAFSTKTFSFSVLAKCATPAFPAIMTKFVVQTNCTAAALLAPRVVSPVLTKQSSDTALLAKSSHPSMLANETTVPTFRAIRFPSPMLTQASATAFFAIIFFALPVRAPFYRLTQRTLFFPIYSAVSAESPFVVFGAKNGIPDVC
mmetsp:Transcript_11950/g.22939  ORF Transcript_11950/g.22939 Transcript_11950/m.22939 type:complete len:170 (-) Transcript_11950:94-603(-)